MARARFRPSKRLVDQLLKATVSERERIGEEIAITARGLAPVGEQGKARRYRDQFDVVVVGLKVVVGNRAPHAHFVEWGTVRQRGQHVMRRAAEAEGLRVKEARKGSSSRSGGE